MNHDQRFRIITEGQRNGVSETCQKYAISRTIYYRWLTRYKKSGMAGLVDIKHHAAPVNKISDEMANLVLSLIRTYPTYGPRELMYRIKDMGYQLSESAIYQFMRRNHLSTRDKRLKFVSKRKQIVSTPSLDIQHLLNDDCWLIWITPYGKFDHLGQIYEYTIFDYQSHIACSRLYQSMSVTCFEDLLTAVAIPVAQSLRLDTHHFCFMQDLEIVASRKQSILDGIEQVLSTGNLEGQMHVLTSSKDFPMAYEKRMQYTQMILSHLMASLNGTVSFDDIKLELQKCIRDYNLNQKQVFPIGTYTPIEYHAVTKKFDVVLPLWAYIDRPYHEAKL